MTALAVVPPSLSPNDEAALLRSIILRRLGRFGEAEQVAHEALTQTPDDRDWRIELTRALGGTERWDDALAVVPPSLSPNDEAALLRSIILRMLGRFGEAEQVAREALTQAPDDRDWRIELARALLMQEQWDDALAAIPASETANDVPALLRATALRNLQRFGEAEQVAREALTQAPDDRDWRIELTRALAGTERWDDALAVVPPSLSPNDEAALLRSIILRMLGRFPEAEQTSPRRAIAGTR